MADEGCASPQHMGALAKRSGRSRECREVTSSTSIELEAPIFADIATRLYAPCLALGTRGTGRDAASTCGATENEKSVRQVALWLHWGGGSGAGLVCPSASCFYTTYDQSGNVSADAQALPLPAPPPIAYRPKLPAAWLTFPHAVGSGGYVCGLHHPAAA